MSRVPITKRGAEKLREELKVLKGEARPRVIAAIAEARAHGDLRENAEYHAAKEQQGFIEGRIAEIESKLSAAQIIDITTIDGAGKVIFGSTVKVVDTTSEDEQRYQIVGDDEADSKKGLISYNSPIAKALIGKSEGDVVEVNAPGGRKELEILGVEYV
jgi:transcription elongation factor GreA